MNVKTDRVEECESAEVNVSLVVAVQDGLRDKVSEGAADMLREREFVIDVVTSWEEDFSQVRVWVGGNELDIDAVEQVSDRVSREVDRTKDEVTDTECVAVIVASRVCVKLLLMVRGWLS